MERPEEASESLYLSFRYLQAGILLVGAGPTCFAKQETMLTTEQSLNSHFMQLFLLLSHYLNSLHTLKKHLLTAIENFIIMLHVNLLSSLLYISGSLAQKLVQLIKSGSSHIKSIIKSDLPTGSLPWRLFPGDSSKCRLVRWSTILFYINNSAVHELIKLNNIPKFIKWSSFYYLTPMVKEEETLLIKTQRE